MSTRRLFGLILKAAMAVPPAGCSSNADRTAASGAPEKSEKAEPDSRARKRRARHRNLKRHSSTSTQGNRSSRLVISRAPSTISRKRSRSTPTMSTPG